MSTKVLSTPIEGAPPPYSSAPIRPEFQQLLAKADEQRDKTEALIQFIEKTPGMMEAFADAFVENYLAISRD